MAQNWIENGRRTGAWILTLSVILIASAQISTAAPVAAYPQSSKVCNDNSMTWSFHGDGTAAQRQLVREGIEKLNTALSYDGARLIDHTELPPGSDADVEVRIEIRAPGSYGFAECVLQKTVSINKLYADDAKFSWKVARHEMFHLSGGQHAGNEDSMNGDNIPTMSTCVDKANFRTVNQLSQDDAAYMNWLHNSLSKRQLHANMGFEQGTSFWGKHNGSMLHFTNGGASSQSYITFWAYGHAYNSYVYQTIRLWTGDDNEQYRSVLNARKTSNNHTAKVKLRLFRRTMTEDSPTGCGSWADGIENANNPTVTGGYVVLSQNPTLTTLANTSWKWHASPWANPATTDGLEIQVRAYGKAWTTSTGQTRRLQLDNIRGEGT